MALNHKSDFRKSCLKKLKFSNDLSKYYKNKIILLKLEKVIKESKAKDVLLYVPMKDLEVDVSQLIKKLRKKNINIYVPYMEGDSFKAIKYRLPLIKKKFGIYEPNNSFVRPAKLDLAVVPIVGVDSLYKRIGFGKGMYDRFFYRLNYSPTIVFTQLSLCKSDEILSNQYDIQANLLITS